MTKAEAERLLWNFMSAARQLAEVDQLPSPGDRNYGAAMQQAHDAIDELASALSSKHK